MKKYFTLLLIISLISCGEKQNQENVRTLPLDANWLTGSWTRINDAEGSQTFEVWQKISEGSYEGKGWTMKNADTVFQEELRIAETDSTWNLEVKGVNEQPVFFRITQYDQNSFTAENRENEFPKKIEYSRNGNKLKAIISDDTDEVEFLFKRSTNLGQ